MPSTDPLTKDALKFVSQAVRFSIVPVRSSPSIQRAIGARNSFVSIAWRHSPEAILSPAATAPSVAPWMTVPLKSSTGTTTSRPIINTETAAARFGLPSLASRKRCAGTNRIANASAQTRAGRNGSRSQKQTSSPASVSPSRTNARKRLRVPS